MTWYFVIPLLSACLCLFCQGCTYRAWYEGLQERQRQECYHNPNQSQVQQCLDRVNKMTYDEYKRHRDASVQKPR